MATLYFGLNEYQMLLDSAVGSQEKLSLNGETRLNVAETQLTKMNLSYNFLSDDLRNEINYLHEITYLDVSANQLQGIFLAAIGNRTLFCQTHDGLERIYHNPISLKCAYLP